MLKLIIADDEKIIRETICNFIDWDSMGIEVAAVCSNGVEAYEAILDVYPDIVLTDIKMPGLSGLELIQKIKEIDTNIQFIILSGYDNFQYAKEAMKFGIQHYLLKPCNEQQIIDAINSVKESFYQLRCQQRLQQQQQYSARCLAQNIIKNLIFECISSDSDLTSLTKNYEQILDFQYTDYKLYYIHYLEKESLSAYLKLLSNSLLQFCGDIAVHMIYVKNTLILFFEDCLLSYNDLNASLRGIQVPGQATSTVIKEHTYFNLLSLLSKLLPKLKRYEQIHLIEHFHLIQVLNHNALFQKTEFYLSELFRTGAQSETAKELYELLASIKDVAVLKTLITDILVRLLVSQQAMFINSEQLNTCIQTINQCTSTTTLIECFSGQLKFLVETPFKNGASGKDFINKIISLVDTFLSNPNLSLKWIAENHLYMNVDYLSKQFVKQTGVKFSSYLTSRRIERAKELLLDSENERISEIAEQVGCGDNPQYFSQLFKKYTGMTPRAYIRTHS